MPNTREPLLSTKVGENSFYDEKVQLVMVKRLATHEPNPLLVLRYVDALARFSGEDSERILPRVLRFFGNDKRFVSEIIGVVTEYHCLAEDKKNLGRLVLDRSLRWFDTSKRDLDESATWMGYRVLGWKEVPGIDARMKKYSGKSIENAAHNMRRRIEDLDGKWEKHIVELRAYDEIHWEQQPELIRWKIRRGDLSS